MQHLSHSSPLNGCSIRHELVNSGPELTAAITATKFIFALLGSLCSYTGIQFQSTLQRASVVCYYCGSMHGFVEGLVNDGFTLGKRELHVSITGPSFTPL
jgi:hypothetical protein